MPSSKLLLTVASMLLVVVAIAGAEVVKDNRARRDSYLDAYAESHGAGAPAPSNGNGYKAPMAPAPAPAPVYSPAPAPPSLFGFDLMTILKIVGKLLLFKLIIKVIAVLCVLLFMPKVEMSMEKRHAAVGGSDALDDLTQFVLGGIEKKSKESKKCGFMCHVQRAYDGNPTLFSFLRQIFNPKKQKTSEST